MSKRLYKIIRELSCHIYVADSKCNCCQFLGGKSIFAGGVAACEMYLILSENRLGIGVPHICDSAPPAPSINQPTQLCIINIIRKVMQGKVICWRRNKLASLKAPLVQNQDSPTQGLNSVAKRSTRITKSLCYRPTPHWIINKNKLIRACPCGNLSDTGWVLIRCEWPTYASPPLCWLSKLEENICKYGYFGINIYTTSSQAR